MATLKELYEQGHRQFKHKEPNFIYTLTNVVSIEAAMSDGWEPVVEKTKKSVLLKRHLLKSAEGTIYLSGWTDNPSEYKSWAILKTEEKIVEWEE